ncbi:hypothetical protein F5I97DRAFT_1935055 [Phlebopus sp. FC_14]|nr:hypothetical protein F5I97DRAFT_1935055 [Phlebopus sp. FC_14]
MNDRRGYTFPSDAGRNSQWGASSTPSSRYPPPNHYQSISNAYPTMVGTAHNVASVHPSSIPYGMSNASHEPSAAHHSTGGYPSSVPNQYAPGVTSNAYHQPRTNYLPSSHHVSPTNPLPQYAIPPNQYPTQHISSHSPNQQPSSTYFAREFQQPQFPASPTRPFSCDLCALSFNRQHDLKRHRETHSGEKPFLCNGGCGKTFTRKDALKRHQLVKHCGHDEDS